MKWFSDQPTPWWLSILAILAWVGFFVGVKNGKRRNPPLSFPNGTPSGRTSPPSTEGERNPDWEENRRRRYILFFAGVAVVGILLSKQTSQPFDSLYYWLYDNMPGFNAFREASKFYVLIALGYAVGIASLVEWLLPKKKA